MNMKKIYIVLGVISLLFLSSCEDFLSKEYENGFVGENFMQTENQAIEAVTAIYDVLNWQGYYYWTSMCLGEGMSDNLENLWGDGSYGPDLVALHNYKWTAENQYFNYRFNNAYTAISRANYVIAKIDDVPNLEEGLKKQLSGEAFFLRAFFYYSIVVGFGDVPLLTEVVNVDDANLVEKAPEAQVWAQIIADLDTAAILLPASYTESADLGRVTSGTAMGMLSRVYLWTDDWQKAIDAADLVTGYTLVSGEQFKDMFNTKLELSSESLFECLHVNSPTNTWSATDAENTILMHIAPFLTWGNYHHPRRVEGYDILDYFEAGDIRLTASIMVPYVDSVPYNGVMGIFPDTVSVDDEGNVKYNWRPNIKNDEVYQMKKFMLEDATTFGYSNDYAANHPILRYAEVLLNKAEACIELNQLPAAVAAITEVRTRAGLTNMVDGTLPSLPSITGSVDISSLNQDQLRELARQERRVELMFECERWNDLKRWDALKDVLPAAGFDYDEAKHKYWPMPAAEVEINPNLGE